MNDVCLRQMMLATPMMTASPNDAWLRHILWQTSHHCGTQWSNIIFAKQMHHIAVGDASFEDIQGYALIYLRKCGTSIFDLFTRLRQQKTHFCLPTKVRFLNDVCLRQMMLATPMMTATPNDVCLRAHKGKHRIIAERSGATSYLRSKCIISP